MRRFQDPELLRRLLRSKDRMAAAPEEEWPVERLAKVSGVSEAHFSRSFKQAFGVPPHRYLLTLRLERAQSLLRESSLSVTEIAFACGWSSLGTFSRTFRDVLGVTPGSLSDGRAPGQPASDGMPVCIKQASGRPPLKIAVLEKRRLASKP